MEFTKKTIENVIDEILNDKNLTDPTFQTSNKAVEQAKSEIIQEIRVNFIIPFVTEDQKAANKEKIRKPKGEPPKGKNLTSLFEKSKRIFKKTDMRQRNEKKNEDIEELEKEINKINETYKYLKEKIKNLLEIKIDKNSEEDNESKAKAEADAEADAVNAVKAVANLPIVKQDAENEILEQLRGVEKNPYNNDDIQSVPNENDTKRGNNLGYDAQGYDPMGGKRRTRKAKKSKKQRKTKGGKKTAKKGKKSYKKKSTRRRH